MYTHEPCPPTPYSWTKEQRSCQEKEEDKVLIWRDHYTADVLQCLMNTVTVLAISCDSGSAASLTIVAFMLFCSSLLCFLMPFSRALCTAIVSILQMSWLASYPDRLNGLGTRLCLVLQGGWGCFSHVNMNYLLIHGFQTVKVDGREKMQSWKAW